MSLAKQRGIYSTPEKWERVRRRARKNNETISRFGERCCRRAAEALGAPPSAPPGHPLALPEDDQRRLLAHSLAVERGMDRRGRRADALALLRRAFGDEAAQTVAAAFMPTAGWTGAGTRGAGGKPGEQRGRGATRGCAAGRAVRHRRRLGSALVCCIRRLRVSDRRGRP